MFSNERSLQIEWGDCDPANIVFYPRYFAFFDASTAALFAAMGYSLTYIRSEMDAVGFPMVDTRSQFYKPSKFGDDVIIKTSVIRVGKASFDVRHELFNDGVLAVECTEKRVFAAQNEMGVLKGKMIPDAMRQVMLDQSL